MSMIKELYYEEFDKYLDSVYGLDGGNPLIYYFKFNNNYAAMVISDRYSYTYSPDLWEMEIGSIIDNTFISSPTVRRRNRLTNSDVMDILRKLEREEISSEGNDGEKICIQLDGEPFSILDKFTKKDNRSFDEIIGKALVVYERLREFVGE